MAGKVRVHELAKELGVRAKDLLALLSEQGEFVKSASSTLEGPVARRVREAYHGKGSSTGGRGVSTKSAGQSTSTNEARRHSAASGASVKKPRQLTAVQLAGAYKRFRQACASGYDYTAIDQLYTRCAKEYGVSRTALRDAIEADFRRNPTEYAPTRQPRRNGGVVKVSAGGHHGAPPTRGDVGRIRPRRDIHLPEVGSANTESIVELVVNIDGRHDDRDEVRTRVRDFYPGNEGVGYLARRYAALRLNAYVDSSFQTAHHDLAVMAQIVDGETQLLDRTIRVHGPVFEQPALAKRVLEAEFNDLTDVDDIGQSAADELRHIRDRREFLQTAVILVIANPECDQRLWEMLEGLRPPAPESLVETSRSLESAIARLTELIDDVESLLSVKEATLGEFFRKAHAELVDLQAGRYGFLRQFKDILSTVKPSRRLNGELPFAILPRGEQLRTFLDGLRSSRRYHGHDVDERRVAVLEEIERHFGADRCQWHVGSASSDGFNNHYVVLTIKSAEGSGHHAVAISPLAGEHATYVVRSDCTEANWMTVLAQSKPDAREQGARKFLFSGAEPYSGMRAKVVDAFECSAGVFMNMTR